MGDFVQEKGIPAVDQKMFYAKSLIITGLVLLVFGLIRGKISVSSSKTKRWKLLRDKPIELKDVMYHPKEWRKPKK